MLKELRNIIGNIEQNNYIDHSPSEITAMLRDAWRQSDFHFSLGWRERFRSENRAAKNANGSERCRAEWRCQRGNENRRTWSLDRAAGIAGLLGVVHTTAAAGVLWDGDERTNQRPTPLFDVVMRLTTIVDPLCIAIIRHVDVTLRRRRRRRFCCQNRIYFHLTVALRPPGSMTHAWCPTRAAWSLVLSENRPQQWVTSDGKRCSWVNCSMSVSTALTHSTNTKRLLANINDQPQPNEMSHIKSNTQNYVEHAQQLSSYTVTASLSVCWCTRFLSK